MQDISIRRFRPTDQMAVATFFREGLTSYGTKSKDIMTIQTWFVNSKLALGGDMYDIYSSYKIELDENVTDRNFWVATAGDSLVVGSIAVIPCPSKTDSMELLRLSVAQDYQGSGVGALLVTHASNWAKAKGYETIVLDTLTAMESAIRFYQRIVFQITLEGAVWILQLEG